MEISNNYSTAKVWNTSNKNVSKSSKKNKWKLTDSLKEKIVDLAKKDAQDNVYMGNAFMNLRKTEVSKVAPNRAALIGKLLTWVVVHMICQHSRLSLWILRRYFPYVEKLMPVISFLRERLGFNDGIIRRLCEFKEADFQTCSTFGTRTMLGLLRHYPTMTAIHTSGTTFRQAVCIMLHLQTAQIHLSLH